MPHCFVGCAQALFVKIMVHTAMMQHLLKAGLMKVTSLTTALQRLALLFSLVKRHTRDLLSQC